MWDCHVHLGTNNVMLASQLVWAVVGTQLE